MADRAEVSKSVAYFTTGDDNSAEVSKVVAYLLLEPGFEGEEPESQAHVYCLVRSTP